ncbi:hypothetical protein [Streptosporangium sandarakinum]
MTRPDPTIPEPEAAPADCNVPHLYGSYERRANCPIGVSTCLTCGAIDWTDLAEQAERLTAQARREERARIAAPLRELAQWETNGGFDNLFTFMSRDERLERVDPIELSMVLGALADLIEGDADV